MQDASLESLMALTFDDIITFEQFQRQFDKVNEALAEVQRELSENQKEVWKLTKEEHELAVQELELKASLEKDEMRKRSEVLIFDELKGMEKTHDAYLELFNLSPDCINYDQDDIPFRIQINHKDSKHLVYRAYLDKERKALERFTLFNKKENSERVLTKPEIKELLLDILRVNFKSSKSADESESSKESVDQFK